MTVPGATSMHAEYGPAVTGNGGRPKLNKGRPWTKSIYFGEIEYFNRPLKEARMLLVHVLGRQVSELVEVQADLWRRL